MAFKLDYSEFKCEITGVNLYAAFHPDTQEEVKLISNYIKQISTRSAQFSLESNFFAVKKFFEYFTKGLEESQYAEAYDYQPFLITLIKNYAFYLSAKTANNSEFNKRIRAKTEHGVLKGTSLQKEISHIRMFLKESAAVYQHSKFDEFNENAALNNVDFHEQLLKIKYATEQQKFRMRSDTLLGSVIKQSKSVKLEDLLPLPKYLKTGGTKKLSSDKIFPFKKFNDLITTSGLREKLIYLLLGAGGLRTHEAIQIRLEDIDHEKGILIRPYEVRKKMDLMSEVQLTAMYAQKGRNTESIYWIPGYESLFNQLLLEYFKERRAWLQKGGIVDHGFIFVKTKDKLGEPLYDSNRSSLNGIFDRVGNKIGVTSKTKHSLRHMYGTYMLNEIPLADGGKGLHPEKVMILMGHKNLNSTMVYAQIDEKEIEKILAEAAEVVMQTAQNNTLKAIGKVDENNKKN